MKYIRTKDGRIVDIEKFINEEKDTPYYKDFIFEEITKDGVLKWTAIGTEQNSMEEQIGIRCHFSAALNSEVIKEADTIEELCDAFIVMSGYSLRHHTFKTLRNAIKHSKLFPFEVMCIYGAIWTDKGLTYVTKMNEKGELELL